MILKNKNKTTDPIRIIDGKAELPSQCYGIVFNKALVFEEGVPDVCQTATCELLEDGKTVAFDPDDELENKYAVIAYLSG